MVEPLSLYLHIPFCVHRCAYCDFNTYARMEGLIPDYILALCREIDFAGKAMDRFLAEPPLVHTIFFGGGTPSLLDLVNLEKIFSAIRTSYRLSGEPEITLEANPGTVSQEYLRGLAQLGVNRISLGMQSAHPADLSLLERQHGLGDVVQAVRWSREAGIRNINLDLIFGIPHQTLDSWQRTLAMALSLRPEHLSLYSLTLEHGTPMERWVRRGLLSEPDSDLAADMYEYSMDRLEQAGYQQYEISNWARGDGAGSSFSCLHNLQYWRLLPYLGIGAGAHGFAAGVRTANVLSPLAYIQHFAGEHSTANEFPGTPATVERIEIDRATEMGELMMMGLRLVQEGVSNARFVERFGIEIDQVYRSQIERLIAMGLLEWKTTQSGDRCLRLTKPGRLLGNRVFREFI